MCMVIIEFTDTEGRMVEIRKRLYNMNVWGIKVDGDSFGGFSCWNGKWELSSISLTKDDLSAIVGAFEEQLDIWP